MAKPKDTLFPPRPWTTEDDAAMVALYATTPNPVLSERFRRSRGAVIARARLLGVTKLLCLRDFKGDIRALWMADAKSKLLAKIEPEPNTGCWLWTGAHRESGYGTLTTGSRSTLRTDLTHRLSWILFRGEIPEGMFVCHRCDNPPCCNPDHLFVAAPRINQIDMAAKGRGAIGRSGLPFGVRRDWNKFQASVCHGGKRHYCGSFPTAELAGIAAAETKAALIAGSGYHDARKTA